MKRNYLLKYHWTDVAKMNAGVSVKEVSALSAEDAIQAVVESEEKHGYGVFGIKVFEELYNATERSDDERKLIHDAIEQIKKCHENKDLDTVLILVRLCKHIAGDGFQVWLDKD